MDNNNSRLTKLDGLRGLLSLVVALNHSFLVVAIPRYANVWNQNILQFTDWQSKIQQLLMLLGNGGAAVTLFFLLSGYVLGLSFSKFSFTFKGVLTYFLKRLIRLYPVYVFLLLFTFVYMNTGFIHQTYPDASSWYNWWMRFTLDLKELLLNLSFIHIYIGGVTWTLRVILIASFLFPVLYLVYRRTNWLLDLLITLLLIYLSFTLFDLSDFRDFRYLYMFYLGLSLPKFKVLFEKLKSGIFYLLLPIVIFLVTDFRYLTDEYIGGVGEAAACWLLLGVIIYGKNGMFSLLENKVLRYFGQISYSLYLIHFTVLYILARIMFTYLKFDFQSNYLITHSLLFLISLPVATIVSHFVYELVEKPSLVLSKKLNNQKEQ